MIDQLRMKLKLKALDNQTEPRFCRKSPGCGRGGERQASGPDALSFKEGSLNWGWPSFSNGAPSLLLSLFSLSGGPLPPNEMSYSCILASSCPSSTTAHFRSFLPLKLG